MTRRRLATFVALVTLLASTAAAIVQPSADGVNERAFRRDDLYIRNVYRTVDQMPLAERLPLELSLQRLGVSSTSAFYDLRSGAWGTLVLSEPLVPGTGKLNALSWGSLGISAPADESELRAALRDAFTAFLAANAADLGFDPAQAVQRVTLHEGGRIAQIHAQRSVGGVEFRDTFVTAVVNSGNLVLLGSRNWGELATSPVATFTAEQAFDAVVAYAGPYQVAGQRRPAKLEFVPLSVGAEPGDAPTGAGLDYALAWAVYPRVAGSAGTWEGLVDAHTGEVLAFRDRNEYFDREMEGGVLPVSNDGLAPDGIPDGIEQPGFPMPFADVIQPFGTSTTTNSSGLAEDIGSVLDTTLAGPFVRMNDLCGDIREVAVCGDLDLGIGAGTDCQRPDGHSDGDTRASRTGFFEVNRIVEQAKGWLPANAWLQAQLTANMNLDQTCNAFWDGETINFYRSGPGTGSNVCRNTGEIAAVFDHEWGHGMDNNDAVPTVSRPGEGPADIAAMVRLNSSCIGRGFFLANARPGAVCSGFGDRCTECTGVRDADWTKRASGLPHDVSWILQPSVGSPGVPGVIPGGGCVGATAPIPTISDGPCGQGTHCEGNVVSEIFWDLIHRDLRCHGDGWERVSGNTGPVAGGRCAGGVAPSFDVNTTLNAVARYHYLGAGNVNEWYLCDASGVAAGCNADGGYLNILAVDDDNGDLTDGTPHFEAIHAAFDRHGMDCEATALGVGDSGCTTPLATPVVDVHSEEQGAHLTWSAVPGASEYWVFRTDGIHGCEFGKERIAITSATELTDAGLKPGRDFFYSVEAVGANGSCRSAASECATAVPLEKTPDVEALAAFREVGVEPTFEILTGDGDEFLDNCEQAILRFAVENAGTVPLTNVRLVEAEPVSHPGTEIVTSLPVALGDLTSAECGSHGSVATSFEFIAAGLSFREPFVLRFAVEADQLVEPLEGTFTVVDGESDFEFMPSRTFSFEADFENWTIFSGNYTREMPGAAGTLVHLASQSLTANQCDEIQSPQVKLTAGSTLELWTQFVTEPGSPDFFDRANVGLFEVETGDRVTIDPDGGVRPYNASGSGGVCVTAGQNGWAAAGPGFLPSSWSPAALDTASRAGERLKIDVTYGTDPLVEGTGFQFDEVTITDFELQVEDKKDDVCDFQRNRPPVARDDDYSTPEGTPRIEGPPGVLGNDSDPDNEALEAELLSGPSNGMVDLAADGSFTYTPDPGFVGTDTFVYQACDRPAGHPDRLCDDATVSISVERADCPGDDDDDFDSDGKRDDQDSDDDNDGDSDNSDSDDDNDGDSDDSDSDDDNDCIADEFDSEAARESQQQRDDTAPAGGSKSQAVETSAATLLLVALAEGEGAGDLTIEIYDPSGTLIATSVSSVGRALATAVPAVPGSHTVVVRNPGAEAVSYRLTTLQRAPW